MALRAYPAKGRQAKLRRGAKSLYSPDFFLRSPFSQIAPDEGKADGRRVPMLSDGNRLPGRMLKPENAMPDGSSNDLSKGGERFDSQGSVRLP